MMQNQLPLQIGREAKSDDDQEMNVMLLKLRGYYDDRLALTKRYQGTR